MSKLRSAIAVGFAVVLAACGTGGGTVDPDAGGEGGQAGGPTIGLSMSTLQNPFFVTLRDGAQEAADAAGADLASADAQDDAQTQVNNIQDFITRGVDVLIVNPVDAAAVVSAIEAANSADIPVITVDRAAEGGEVVSHIASDNVAGGRLAGELLFERIGGSGPVAQLEGVAGTSAARDRGEGFSQALEAAEGVELVATQTANFNRDEGFTVAQNIFQANPQLKGMFAQNDEMALGAVEAARQAGVLENLTIVGFDATEDGIAAVAAGEMAGTVAQQPAEMGRIAVETAVSVAAGEEVEADQPIEVQLVTMENVSEYQ
jgi:ribose transport system substrate-binding protein